MDPVRCYHNPQCSKSRATLALLEERGIPVQIVPYLDEPLDRATLRRLADKLPCGPLQLIRQSEPCWREHYPTGVADDEAALDALIAHPILLQRPIVEHGSAARIGRPPEAVLDLFDRTPGGS